MGSERACRLFLVALPLLVALPGGCHHLPLRNPIRPTEPLPDALRQKLRPLRLVGELEVELIEERSVLDRYRLRFRYAPDGPAPRASPAGEADAAATDSDAPEPVEVVGEYYRVRRASAAAPAPLLQIAPILGGAHDDYLASRVFAGWAAADGLSSFFLYQEETILAPERNAAELEERLIKTTRENMLAIGLFAARPEVDGARIGSFGISMGAIKNVLLVAAESRLKGSILCLAGGDFARIMAMSRENMVLEYIRDRGAREGIGRDAIAADFAANLSSDPIRVARSVDPRKVIMFLGSLDDKVPYATGLALHRELGGPELFVFPLGHYTSMVVAPRAAELGFDWLKRRFEE